MKNGSPETKEEFEMIKTKEDGESAGYDKRGVSDEETNAL